MIPPFSNSLIKPFVKPFGVSAGFLPSDLADLELWLDANDALTLILNGADVSQWLDKSINLRHATQSTAADQPFLEVAGQNGKDVIAFDGTEFLNVPDLSSLTGGDIFFVVKTDLDPNPNSFLTGLSHFGSDASITHFPFTNSSIFDQFGTTSRKAVGNPSTPLDQWNIYNAISVAGEWTARLAGSQIFTTGTNTVGFTATPFIGRDATNVFLTGKIAEIILYSSKLTTVDRARVEAYLDAKWNFPANRDYEFQNSNSYEFQDGGVYQFN